MKRNNMSEELKKIYPANGLEIVWKPGKCLHAGICVKTLPEVYNPKDKPWIQPGETSAEELILQINACPSGALSYRMAGPSLNQKK